MSLYQHILVPVLSLAYSGIEMFALAFGGAFTLLIITGFMLLIGFVFERTIMRSRIGNTSNFINDRVLPAFEKFFGDKNVLLFIYLTLFIYNWIGFYYDFPTIREFLF